MLVEFVASIWLFLNVSSVDMLIVRTDIEKHSYIITRAQCAAVVISL